MHAAHIPAANCLASNRLTVTRVSQKMVARLSCDWRAFTCGQFATTSALEVIAWLSHGDHMVDVCSLAITCHFSATKLITGRFLNMFKNHILNARSLAFTCGYYSDRTNAVRLTYVYFRSLTITCRNHP